MGAAFRQAQVGRGAAYADIDNDGDLDLVITTSNGRARLLRNDGGNENDVLQVKTIGTHANRDGMDQGVAHDFNRAAHERNGEKRIELYVAK